MKNNDMAEELGIEKCKHCGIVGHGYIEHLCKRCRAKMKVR